MHFLIIQGGEQRKNKLLVHCHAGQGRTAIVIGAYLLYADLAKSSEEAIKLCQQGRPKLFTNSINGSQAFLHKFEVYLRQIRVLYPYNEDGDFSYEDLLSK